MDGAGKDGKSIRSSLESRFLELVGGLKYEEFNQK